jgi:hypothetical protein
VAESWILKVNRAEKHFVELGTEVTSYTGSHPYRAVRSRQRKRDRNIWRYHLVMTEQPDPNLAVIIGDVIHNLRSALDHLAVATVPSARKSHARFPIELQDIWAKDEAGKYLIADDERRRRFLSDIKGMSDDAKALIFQAQPYGAGDQAHRAGLGVIGRLENADKHHKLIVVAPGIDNPVFHFFIRGTERYRVHGEGFAKDGAEIADLSIAEFPNLDESEVEVKVDGSVIVGVDVGVKHGEGKGYMEVMSLLGSAIVWERTQMFRALEPHIRR